MFGENLLLTRVISTALGENRITIEDTVENQGFRSSPFMLLYHINIGYPVVSEKAEWICRKHDVTPRDAEAKKGIGVWDRFQRPTSGYSEQVFYHDLPAGRDGFARIAIRNPDLGLELEVAYRKKELPFMTQWKQMGKGEYVMGIEPANCHPEGMAAERDKFHSLRVLKPGETASARLEIVIREL
jgi:hypothetical protein